MRVPVIAILLVTSASPAFAADSPARKRVAVFDFDKAAAEGGGGAISIPFFQTTAPNVGKTVADLLVTRLVQNAAVSVIERSALDKVIAEQNLSNSDRTDAATAAKIGRLLGLDGIILGSITRYDFEDKTTGGGSSFGGFGRGSMTTKHDIKANVQITARLVSPDTAEVLSVSQGAADLLRKGVKVDMRDTRAMMTGAAGNPIMTEATDQAVTQLAGQLGEKILKLPPRVLVIDGLVADAGADGRLILNVGSRNGVKLGDTLQVWHPGKEVRDPQTGKVLLRDDRLLGEAVVGTVNDISSIASYKGTEKVNVGDLVKSPPKQ